MTFSLSDAKNEAGKWTMSPEQIRAEQSYIPEYDPYEYDEPDYDDDARERNYEASFEETTDA